MSALKHKNDGLFNLSFSALRRIQRHKRTEDAATEVTASSNKIENGR